MSKPRAVSRRPFAAVFLFANSGQDERTGASMTPKSVSQKCQRSPRGSAVPLLGQTSNGASVSFR